MILIYITNLPRLTRAEIPAGFENPFLFVCAMIMVEVCQAAHDLYDSRAQCVMMYYMRTLVVRL